MAIKEWIFLGNNCHNCLCSRNYHKIHCILFDKSKLIKENVCYDVENQNECTFKRPIKSLEEILNG